jgi:hypothetical protein
MTLMGDATLQAYAEVIKHRGDHGIFTSCPQFLMKSRLSRGYQSD